MRIMNWHLKSEMKLIREMKSKSLFLIPLLLLILLTSCQQETLKFNPEEGIVNTWFNGAGELVLAKEGVLQNNSLLNLSDTSGNWTFNSQDSILTLYTYDKTVAAKEIDSIIVTGADQFSYYSNGELVKDSKNEFIKNGGQITNLKLTRIDTQRMVFQHNGNDFVLDLKSNHIESSFTLMGFLRGLLGMVSLLAIAWLFSSNRKAINWTQIGKGLLLQIVVAVLILKVDFIATGFEFVSSAFVKVTDFAKEGATFLFSSFISGEVEHPMITFATWVLPTIIFFSALTSLLYYWGILQRVVYVFAWVMKKLMNLSGAESMAAAGNIFLGQTESPLLVRPYLSKMTNSEILCLMTGGMATIAGGVLAAYIGFLGGNDPQEKIFFAKHLLTASVMSAPAAIIFSKILLPETEEVNKELKVPKEKLGSNALEAISNGTTDGIKLAVNVGAMLIVFISLMAFGNAILLKIGDWTTLNEVIAENTQYSGLTFQFILGYLLAPLSWLMGVESADMFKVGQLLGEKTVLNEFVAYTSLGKLKATMSNKSIIMATYILCGFANFASIGIQIGGIGALAPEKKGTLSKYGFKALIGGTFACLMTAVIVGMMY